MFTESAPRILIADDDPDFCAVVSLALSDEGYSPSAVHTVDDAVVALSTHTWSLVLVDSFGTVPGPAFEAAVDRLMTAAGDETPFVLTTGWQVDDELEGFAAVMRKPLDLEPFLTVIARLAAGSEGTRH